MYNNDSVQYFRYYHIHFKQQIQQIFEPRRYYIYQNRYNAFERDAKCY